MSQKTRITLLFGGRSVEHEVSLASAASIYRNLDKNKFGITSIYINREGDWKSVESPLLATSELNKGKFHSFLPWEKEPSALSLETDIYFPVLHGSYGEDGTIQGFFEMADVPYVGATVLASALGMDKVVSKTLFKAKNLPVVKHLTILQKEWTQDRKAILKKIEKEFPFPCFIKPANLGSSVGVTKVKEKSQAEPALETAFLYDKKILVEEGILGRELECSVLGNDEPISSLPGELIPYREFYDYNDKYIEGKTSFIIPADIPSSIAKEIQRISIEAFKALDCSGMARVDFFLQERTENVFLNELNTIPGFTEISMYPKMWEKSGLPYPELLEKLISLGLDSHYEKKRNGIKFRP